MIAMPTMRWPGLRSGHPLAEGLVALWPLWEGSGSGPGNIVDSKYRLGMPGNGPAWVGSEFGSTLLFDDANTEYLGTTPTPVSAPPFTMACWFTADDLTASLTLMSIADASTGDDWHDLQVRGTIGGDPIAAASRHVGAAAARATTTTGIVANEWFHGCGVWAATNSRSVYLNAAGKATETTAIVPVGIDRVGIGLRYDSTPAVYYSGHIAMPAIWNRALSDEEVKELYEDPWGLITPRRRTYLFYQAPAAGNPWWYYRHAMGAA